METVVLLAGDPREADAYRLDTGKRYAVYASTPAQVHRATTIIELPLFKSRRDRFRLEQARDSRIKYGRNVQYIDAGDWVRPVRAVEDPQVEDPIVEESILDRFDFTDERDLLTLKVKLNEVGYTLKKLPKKTPAEAPVVDAPVEF